MANILEIACVEKQKQLSPDTRRANLESKLVECGLQLRADSQLCNEYIATGFTCSVNNIVIIMTEMDWLHRNTDYGAIRGQTKKRNQRLRPGESSRIKERALEGYILKRLNDYRWTRIQDEPDTPARPPKSLWKTIDQLLPDSCKKYALDCFLVGIASDSSRRKYDPMCAEELIRVMDIGAASEELYTQSFSRAMQTLLGESIFHDMVMSVESHRRA